MLRSRVVSKRIVLWALMAAALTLGSGTDLSARPDDHKGHMHDKHFDHCAKECARCMLECESCARHCADLLSKGDKKHFKTLGTCADCGDFCALAARIVARRGPTAVTTCEACAKVCDICAKACEEYPNDEHMKRCAKACRDCAKACREMVKHAGHHHDHDHKDKAKAKE
jgi:hypothetical protein